MMRHKQRSGWWTTAVAAGVILCTGGVGLATGLISTTAGAPTAEQVADASPWNLTLSVDHETVKQGEAAVLTVRIAPNATGVVRFYDAIGTRLGMAPINDDTAVLELSGQQLSLGTHEIAAEFEDDATQTGGYSNLVSVTVIPAS